MREDRLERLIQARDRFKTPTFDGMGDVQYFMRHFREVADINQWGVPAMRVHLSGALKKAAKSC